MKVEKTACYPNAWKVGHDNSRFFRTAAEAYAEAERLDELLQCRQPSMALAGVIESDESYEATAAFPGAEVTR
jgi:hypothetical protein